MIRHFLLFAFLIAIDEVCSVVKTMDDIANEFLEYPNEKMWRPIEHITNKFPFIFFHQRKAGGTSIRHQLRAAADHDGLNYFIPCRDDVPCTTFEIRAEPPVAIYAGHFQWGAQNVLHSLAGRAMEFSCTTNIREPISRIISCFNERFKSVIRNRCMNDIQLNDLDRLFRRRLQGNNGTCINEPFRMISGANSGEILELQNLAESQDLNKGDWTIAEVNIMSRTLQHLKHCPPIVLEIPQSLSAIDKRFSREFNGGYAVLTPEVVAHRGSNDSCRSRPTGARLELFKKYAYLELALYTIVHQKVHKYVESDRFLNMEDRASAPTGKSRRKSGGKMSSKINNNPRDDISKDSVDERTNIIMEGSRATPMNDHIRGFTEETAATVCGSGLKTLKIDGQTICYRRGEKMTAMGLTQSISPKEADTESQFQSTLLYSKSNDNINNKRAPVVDTRTSIDDGNINNSRRSKNSALSFKPDMEASNKKAPL